MTRFVKILALLLVPFILTMSSALLADDTPKTMNALSDEMVKAIAPLQKVEGWAKFIESHSTLFATVGEQGPTQFLEVSDLKLKVGDDEFTVGMGARSIWIAASPKAIVQTVNNPHVFEALYGLDKPADIYPVNADGSFQARIYKLVPGIETQDYTLNYVGHWEGDSWIQEATQVKDEKGFALRENIKIVTPSGKGSLFREVSLLYPRRWWARLMHGTAQNIFKRELSKLNKSLKCASEKVQGGTTLTKELAGQCFKEAQN